MIARRSGNQWYIAASNAENQVKEVVIQLDWLKEREMNVIYDKKDRSIQMESVKVNKKGEIVITMESQGGVVIYSNKSNMFYNT